MSQNRKQPDIKAFLGPCPGYTTILNSRARKAAAHAKGNNDIHSSDAQSTNNTLQYTVVVGRRSPFTKKNGTLQKENKSNLK